MWIECRQQVDVLMFLAKKKKVLPTIESKLAIVTIAYAAMVAHLLMKKHANLLHFWLESSQLGS